MFSKDAKAYKHTIPESLYKTSSRNENNNIHPFIFKKNPNCLNTRKRHKIRIIQHQQRKKQLDQTTSVKEDFSRRIFLKLLRKTTTSILSPTLYTKHHRGIKMTIFTNLFSRKILTASTERKRHKILSIQNQRGKKQLEQSTSVKEDFFKAVARRKFMLLTKSLSGLNIKM